MAEVLDDLEQRYIALLAEVELDENYHKLDDQLEPDAADLRRTKTIARQCEEIETKLCLTYAVVKPPPPPIEKGIKISPTGLGVIYELKKPL